ncbi:acylphosphatase [Hymenobacter seoulensis]
MNQATEQRTIRVYGQVQGVFYRQSASQQASSLGLAGYVQNNPDGTVTLKAEGPAAALDALETWCRQGPPAARVERLEVTTGELQGYRGFEVRRHTA